MKYDILHVVEPFTCSTLGVYNSHPH